jgi:hypothetical protein
MVNSRAVNLVKSCRCPVRHMKLMEAVCHAVPRVMIPDPKEETRAYDKHGGTASVVTAFRDKLGTFANASHAPKSCDVSVEPTCDRTAPVESTAVMADGLPMLINDGDDEEMTEGIQLEPDFVQT